MKVLVVTSFTAFEGRARMIGNYFENIGYDVTYISSDFDHQKKQFIEKPDGFVRIKTKRYDRNLSISRISTHIKFAKSVKKKILNSRVNYDIIYVILPVNSLAKEITKLKLYNTKIYFDIEDLWPESLPFKNKLIYFFPPIIYWKYLRNRYIKKSEGIILECEYYKRFIPKKCSSKTSVIRLCDTEKSYDPVPIDLDGEIRFCYLGSINNIIDIDRICNLLVEVQKIRKVHLDIVGVGESENKLKKELISNGIEFKHHGAIYDNNLQYEIFAKCHYALNIMKDYVEVGLTMKSVQYFKFAIPIVNNIKGDTAEFISKHKSGFNIVDDNYELMAKRICSIQLADHIEMQLASQEIYDSYLGYDTASKNLDLIFKQK